MSTNSQHKFISGDQDGLCKVCGEPPASHIKTDCKFVPAAENRSYCENCHEHRDVHTVTCSLAKEDIGQLKAIRDGLIKEFRTEDKLLMEFDQFASASILRATVKASRRRRLKEGVERLSTKIAALTKAIEYIEAQAK